jgi:hypothetical protein
MIANALEGPAACFLGVRTELAGKLAKALAASPG